MGGRRATITSSSQWCGWKLRSMLFNIFELVLIAHFLLNVSLIHTWTGREWKKMLKSLWKGTLIADFWVLLLERNRTILENRYFSNFFGIEWSSWPLYGLRLMESLKIFFYLCYIEIGDDCVLTLFCRFSCFDFCFSEAFRGCLILCFCIFFLSSILITFLLVSENTSIYILGHFLV